MGKAFMTRVGQLLPARGGLCRKSPDEQAGVWGLEGGASLSPGLALGAEREPSSHPGGGHLPVSQLHRQVDSDSRDPAPRSSAPEGGWAWLDGKALGPSGAPAADPSQGVPGKQDKG